MSTSTSFRSEFRPRVNGKNLMRYVNRRVLLVCRVESQTDTMAMITTTDGRSLQVHKMPGSVYPSQPGNVVELQCTVNPAGMCQEVSFVDWSGSDVPFNFENYNELLQLMQVPEIASVFTSGTAN